MLLITVMCLFVATALSQCPPPNSCGSTANNNTCKAVKTIPRPLSEIAQVQPLYMVLLPNISRANQADNLCVTFFPLPDSCETYKGYLSWVYIDGSTLIETFVTKTIGTGANIWAGATRGYTNYILGSIGCGSELRYTCPNYGNAVYPSLISYGPGIGPMGNGTGKLSGKCISNARRLANKNGIKLQLEDYYLLPYNLPTNCVTEQICLPTSNPLYCQQGQSCKAYNSTNCC